VVVLGPVTREDPGGAVVHADGERHLNEAHGTLEQLVDLIPQSQQADGVPQLMASGCQGPAQVRLPVVPLTDARLPSDPAHHESDASSLVNPTPFLLSVISTPSATCRRMVSSVTWVTEPWIPPMVTT